MKGRLIGSILLALSQVGCGSGYYSPDDLHRSVRPHPNRAGLYLFHYRYKEMIEEYGPGWEKTLEAVRQAKSNKEIHTIWEQSLAFAVPTYLEEKRLTPSECVGGIVVISSSMDEAGGGTTAFRCK